MNYRGFISLAILIGLSLPASGQESGEKRITLRPAALTPPKRISDEDALDINGDGLKDIVLTLAENDDAAVHRLVIYLQKAAGFSALPDVIMDLPAPATMVDFGRLDGDKLLDLAVLTDRALIGYRQTAGGGFGRAAEALALDPLLRAPPRGFMIFVDFLRDLNGDGRDELLLPAGGGFALFPRRPDLGFDPPLNIPGLVSASFDALDRSPNPLFYRNELLWYYSVPRPWVIDLNGDGRNDLVFPDAEGFAVAYGNAAGSFNLPPQRVRIEPPALPADVVDSRLIKFFQDIDGDRLPEIWAVRYYGKGIRSRNINLIKSEVFCYKGRAGFPEKLRDPLYQTRFDGFVSFPPVFADFNGDSRLDFALFFKELSIASLATSFFLGSLGLDVSYFLQSPSRRFDPQPAYSRKVRTDFDPDTFLLDYSGDFNGDGRPDLLSGRFADNEFDIMFGNSEGEFGTPYDIYFNAKLTNAIRIIDLDGNGLDDIVEYNTKANRVNIFYSLPERQ